MLPARLFSVRLFFGSLTVVATQLIRAPKPVLSFGLGETRTGDDGGDGDGGGGGDDGDGDDGDDGDETPVKSIAIVAVLFGPLRSLRACPLVTTDVPW